MDHNRGVEVYFLQTRATHTYDTVTFSPHSIPFLLVNLNDYLKQEASDIIHLLTAPPFTTTPSIQAGDPVHNALLDIVEQLQLAQPIPDTPGTQSLEPEVLYLRVVKDSPPPRVQKTDQETTLQPEQTHNHLPLRSCNNTPTN